MTQMNLLDGENAKSKMKNTLRGINSRLVLSEENVSELEDSNWNYQKWNIDDKNNFKIVRVAEH